MQYNKGLVIGRFQPFHNGHLCLIQNALNMCTTIQVGIGSVNKKNDLNPYPYSLRKEFIEAVIKNENLKGKITGIYPLYDNASDSLWLKRLIKKLGTPDVVIGNNDWVNGIFRNAGISVKEIEYCNRELYEGSKIRQLIQSGQKWEDRVPSYLVQAIKTHSDNT